MKKNTRKRQLCFHQDEFQCMLQYFYKCKNVLIFDLKSTSKLNNTFVV